MDDIIKILEQIKPGVDFKTEENLIEEEILDSFDIVTLVAKLNDEFDIEISPADLIPENFNSAEKIYELVTRLEEEWEATLLSYIYKYKIRE